ncbi:MAG TPA: hypothetical protein VIY99_20660 [Terracidiphilus sp.]
MSEELASYSVEAALKFCYVERMQKQGAILQARFAHRRNANGTFDSICCQCFATVSRQSNPSNNVQLEDEHVCSSLDLHRFETRLAAWPEAPKPQQKKAAKPMRKKSFAAKMPPKSAPHGLASHHELAGLMAG